jgi:hypothetical protein
MADAYNSSYSGGRNQEDCSSKPAGANNFVRSSLRKTLHKNRVGGVAQREGFKFKPLYHKKKIDL